MVKKLYKHEILAYLRVWLPTQIILLAVALFGRLLQFFESNTTIYNIIFGSAMFAYFVAIIASLGVTMVFGISRFYKNLYTAEGYLTHTLPITATQHILVKLTTSVMFHIATVIVALISVCVLTAGEVMVEIFKAAGYLIKVSYINLKADFVFYAIEFIIALMVTVFSSFLLYYTCISIGQLFKKNRVLAAVGIYFGIYAAGQIASTIFIIFTTSGVFNDIMRYFSQHPLTAGHVVLCVVIAVNLILSLVYFTITRSIMTKKLNLE